MTRTHFNHLKSRSPLRPSSLVRVPMTRANVGLRLVNSKWDKFVIPRLYQRIHLSSAHQTARLLPTLQQIPIRRILIQKLVVSIRPTTDTRDYETYTSHRILRKLFQRHLPALKQLHLHATSFISSMIYLKDSLRGKVSLTQLLIRCHGPLVTMSTTYIWSILREFPELEEFRFEFRSDEGVKRVSVSHMPKALNLHSMKKLEITGVVIHDDIVESLCCACPNLEELEIDGENRFCII
jgi:hypothetical protein